MARLGRTDVVVFPLCLGGNVFGWTANEQESFAVLDAYAAAGGNFIDTADSYSAWVPGHAGGESETIIGRWMATRRARSRTVVATKVGRAPGRLGLSPKNIRAAAEASLRRLGVDRIDHLDDRGRRLLNLLDEVAAAHKTTVAAVSLAWLRAQPTVCAPIASARTVAQLAELVPMATLTLSSDELGRLGELTMTGRV